VDTRPKSWKSWTREDWDAEEEPKEFVLVGLWDSLQVDPRVWGLPARGSKRAQPLLTLTVRGARRALAHAAALQKGIPGYSQEGAVYPKIWPEIPGPDQVHLDAAPEEQLRRMGLPGMEERWRRTLEAAAANHAPDTFNQPPAWLDLAHHAPPRPSRAEREAVRQAGAAAAAVVEANAPAALAAGYQHVWRSLRDPTLHRQHMVTCWAALHGVLGCKAFLAAVRLKGQHVGPQAVRDSAACSHPQCREAPGLVLETLSHALVDCPAVAPAIDWLLATWAHLTGADPPPRNHAVLLLDDAAAWPGGPATGTAERRLWTRLRVATLGSIWELRTERRAGGGDAELTLARAAAQRALDTVLTALHRDWRRSRSAWFSQYPDLGRDWWRGLVDVTTEEHFRDQWTKPPHFAAVDDGHLVVKIGAEGSPALPA